jgi:mRNA m6A methyltransferase non-catalytic subunit
MATTTELLSSAYSALEAHARLMKDVEASHNRRRTLLASLPESSLAGIEFPEFPARSPSPPSPKADFRELDPHSERQRRQLERTDLPKEKLEKVKRYRNYVPEEETIRNDYSQQYVDSGEWPQNWVLGAELERRFEE